MQWGKAAVACVAHNNDVGGSNPLPAISLFIGGLRVSVSQVWRPGKAGTLLVIRSE